MLNARARAVARWEFRRFAKAKDLVVGMIIFAALFGAGTLFGEFAGRKLDARRTIAVLEPERLGLAGPLELIDLELVPHAASAATLDSLLVEEEIDAALVPLGEDAWELRVRRERTWTQTVQAQLAALVQQVRIGRLDLAPEVLETISTPPTLTTTVVDPPTGLASKASPVSAIFVVALMMLGLFVGFSYVFVAITGEKTQRVTESLLSAVSPQEWIDGKIAGLTTVVLANLASTILGYLLWKTVAAVFFGGDFGAPEGIASSVLPISLAFAALGFLFWFTCFAMLAATIDDPTPASAAASCSFPSCRSVPSSPAWTRPMRCGCA